MNKKAGDAYSGHSPLAHPLPFLRDLYSCIHEKRHLLNEDAFSYVR